MVLDGCETNSPETPSLLACTGRLLIVDDEAEVARIIERVGLQLGLQVLAISDSARFEDALGTIDPTLVFLDLSMPGRDGIELMAQLATRNYAGKIVVMSGSDERLMQMSGTIAKARGLAVEGLLSKPFRKQRLQELLISLAPSTRPS
jgi:CheY-like chemotaxis protein